MYEAWEIQRELRQDEFERKVKVRTEAYEIERAKAESPEEAEALYAKYTSDLDQAIEREQSFNQWMPFYGAIGTLLVCAVVWGLSELPIAWNDLPGYFKKPGVCFLAAPVTGLLGWGFFLLRKKRRFAYATLELAVACVTSYKSAVALGGASVPDRWGYIFALLGSVYVAVRAFDNFDKYFHPDDAKFKEIVAKALASAQSVSSTAATQVEPNT
jgi:hypothetical protein